MNGAWEHDEIMRLSAKVAYLEDQLQVICLAFDIKLKPYKETTP